MTRELGLLCVIVQAPGVLLLGFRGCSTVLGLEIVILVRCLNVLLRTGDQCGDIEAIVCCMHHLGLFVCSVLCCYCLPPCVHALLGLARPRIGLWPFSRLHDPLGGASFVAWACGMASSLPQTVGARFTEPSWAVWLTCTDCSWGSHPYSMQVAVIAIEVLT